MADQGYGCRGEQSETEQKRIEVPRQRDPQDDCQEKKY